jgi:hypothetical protein
MQLVFLLLLVLSVDIGPVFDEYDTRISIKQENERLDNYAIQLQYSPSSRALIVVYAENKKTAASVKARARRALKYLVRTRGVDPARVAWRYEAVCRENLIILFHLYPDQADPVRDSKCLR